MPFGQVPVLEVRGIAVLDIIYDFKSYIYSSEKELSSQHQQPPTPLLYWFMHQFYHVVCFSLIKARQLRYVLAFLNMLDCLMGGLTLYLPYICSCWVVLCVTLTFSLLTARSCSKLPSCCLY